MGVTIRYLNEEESKELFDEIARREMGISGDEFLSRWDAGIYSNEDLTYHERVPGLLSVYMALPLVRNLDSEGEGVKA